MLDHSKIEKNATLLLILSFVVVIIGGLVQITPLFYLENTIEKVDGMPGRRRVHHDELTSLI